MLVEKEKLIEKEPGIYHDISFEDYVRINAINHSTLKKFMSQSPFHFKYKWENGMFKDTDSLKEGRVIHEAVLEPEKFKKKYVKTPDDWRDYKDALPKKERKYCERKEKEAGKEGDGGFYFINKNANAYSTIMDIFKAQLGDNQVPIEPDLLWKCKQIRRNLKGNDACQKLFDESEFEVTYVWVDEETGLKCKGRLDVDSNMKGYACDLKTTRSTYPYGFAKDVNKFNYYSAAAFYMDGAVQLGHSDFKAFIWLACETEDPFYTLPFYTRTNSDWISDGRKWYRNAIEKFHYCKSTGDWHGYYDKLNDSFDMYELPEKMW